MSSQLMRNDVWDNRSLGGPKACGNYWDDYNGTIRTVTRLEIVVPFFPLVVDRWLSIDGSFCPCPAGLRGIVASPRAGTAPFTTTFKADVLGT